MPKTWSVVCTVNEPIALLRKFHGYYLAQGASEVHYFVDNPEMEGIDELRSLPKARVDVCDEHFWNGTLKRPRFVEFDFRHLEYINFGYRTLSTDFGLFCDADELFHMSPTISDYISSIPAGTDTILVKPREAVYENTNLKPDYFETTYFKIASGYWNWGKPKQWKKLLYLKKHQTGLTKFQRQGFWGHQLGKSIVRRHRPMFGMTSHVFKPAAPNSARIEWSKGVLLHFDCASVDHWLKKVQARYGKLDEFPEVRSARRNQFTEFGKRMLDQSPGSLSRLFEECHCLSPQELQVRRKLGLVVQFPELKV